MLRGIVSISTQVFEIGRDSISPIFFGVTRIFVPGGIIDDLQNCKMVKRLQMFGCCNRKCIFSEAQKPSFHTNRLQQGI